MHKDDFREKGYQLIDQLANYLNSSIEKDEDVLKFNDPEREIQYWSELKTQGLHSRRWCL